MRKGLYLPLGIILVLLIAGAAVTLFRTGWKGDGQGPPPLSKGDVPSDPKPGKDSEPAKPSKPEPEPVKPPPAKTPPSHPKTAQPDGSQPEPVRPAPPPSMPSGVKGYREVFYATDRVAAANQTFGPGASEDGTLRYGRALISIPQSHKRGELERPWRIYSLSLSEDASKHIIVTERGALDETAFYREVTKAIDAAPDSGAFVFVHGFNVSFDDALLRAGQLAWDMKYRGPAVTYSWPSAGATARYVSDLDMADWTAPHLAGFLRDLRRRTDARTIHLVAHSMGSRVLTMALDRLALLDPNAASHFQEVVLAAPDINARVLSQLSSALKAEADRVTIYASNRDHALQASNFLRRGAGDRVGSVAGATRLGEGYDIIDATRARSSLLGHSYFAEDSTLLNDLALLLKQRLGPDQRSITLERSGPIWVFRP